MGKFKELDSFVRDKLFSYTDDFITDLLKEFGLEKKDVSVTAVNNDFFITLYTPIGKIELSIIVES